MRLELTNDPRVQLLARRLGEPIPSARGEVRFNSPFRNRFKDRGKPDTGHHLYVNVQNGKFFDYKSSQCGSISYLFYLLGIAGDSTPVGVPTEDSLREKIRGLDEVRSFVLPVAELPEWYHPITFGSVAYQYVISRGLTPDDVLWYRLGEGTFNGDRKVVIPSFGSEGECEYWVARSLRRETKIRYLNPPVERRYHVGFLHLASLYSKDLLVLCEGVFSALVGGRDCIASYGKFVTDFQLQRIRRCGVKELCVALDGDALPEALDTVERALHLGMAVSWVRLPINADPADLGRAEFRKLVADREPLDRIGVLRIRIREL